MLETPGDLPVGGVQPHLGVDQKQDQIGFVEGKLGRVVYKLLHQVIRIGRHATGVDQVKSGAGPVTDGIVAIASDPRSFVHHGQLPLQHTVEQRRFADVGAPHYGYRGQFHAKTSLIVRATL